MKASEVREKYLKFFESKGHKRIPPAPLVLENDPTTLFTSAGMQPLIPYLKGKKHEKGTKLVDSQPSIRLQDIEEVGDNRHTTFFEMLGNWSLGDYFKKEQLPWVFEFLTKELDLPKEKLWVSVFEGDKNVSRDNESFEVWKSLGIAEERICFYGVKKNWWSNSGTPEEMLTGDIGGPDSEVFYDFGKELGLHEKSPWKDEKCHPNCDCGRFLEIGNSVFIQYQKESDRKLKELPQKNVDFGGGLERLTAATNNDPDVFKIDMFEKAVKSLEVINKSGDTYNKNPKPFRIIVDHLRAAAFLVADGVEPSNKLHGYIVRRLIRRSMVQARLLKLSQDEWLSNILSLLVSPYVKTYPKLEKNFKDVDRIITVEVDKFRKTIDRGLREFEKLEDGQLNASSAFNLFQTYGFPFEVTKELYEQKGKKLDKEEFDKAFETHQQLSRTTAAKIFKGGLADHSVEVTKLHTATHLLHAALRKILGNHVSQKGSNITSERLRFDYTHPTKLSDEEKREIEELVNEQIKKSLPVSFEIMSLDQAEKRGALHFFNERYGEKVKVYSIGDFSKEVCGGPHVTNTSELGEFNIIKEESLGTGVRRIYCVLQ